MRAPYCSAVARGRRPGSSPSGPRQRIENSAYFGAQPIVLEYEFQAKK